MGGGGAKPARSTLILEGSSAKCIYTHVCTHMYMLLNVHTIMHVWPSLDPGHNLNSTR